MSKKAKQEKVNGKKFITPVVTSFANNDYFEYGTVSQTGDAENNWIKKEHDSILRSIDIVRKFTFNGASTFTFQEYSNRLEDPQNLKLAISTKMQAIVNKVVFNKIHDKISYQSLIDEESISDYMFDIGPTSIVNLLDIFTEEELELVIEPYFKEKSLCLTEVIFSVQLDGKKDFVEKLRIIVGLMLPNINRFNIGYAKSKDRTGTIVESHNSYIIEEITTGLGTSVVYNCKNEIEPFILIDKINTGSSPSLSEYVVVDSEKKFNFEDNYFFNKIMSRDIENSKYIMRFNAHDNTTIKDGVVENLDISYDSSASIYNLLDYIYKTIDAAICRLGYVGISRTKLEELCHPNPPQEKIDEEKKKKERKYIWTKTSITKKDSDKTTNKSERIYKRLENPN